MSSSQVGTAVKKYATEIANFEVMNRHKELEKSGKNHTYGVRKNLIGGRELFLVESSKHLSFKEAVKHPSEAIKKLIELIDKIKTSLYQKLHIDISSKKNPSYIAQFERKVTQSIDALPQKYAALKPFGLQVSGEHNLAQQLANAKDRIQELEAQDAEALQEQVTKLTKLKGKIEAQLTGAAQKNQALERDLAILKNKVTKHKDQKTHQFETALHNHYNELKEDIKKIENLFHHRKEANHNNDNLPAPVDNSAPAHPPVEEEPKKIKKDKSLLGRLHVVGKSKHHHETENDDKDVKVHDKKKDKHDTEVKNDGTDIKKKDKKKDKPTKGEKAEKVEQ